MKFMQMTAFSDAGFTNLTRDHNNVALRPYRFMLNPDAIKLQHTFTSDQPNASKLSFDMVIDATGLIDPKRIDLPAEMARLQAIMYSLDGQNHHPNFVKIEWGDYLVFYGVLASMDVNYTLFKPDGTPLRVKIALSFDQRFPEVAASAN